MWYLNNYNDDIVEIIDILEDIECNDGSNEAIVIVNCMATKKSYTCLRSTLTRIDEAS